MLRLITLILAMSLLFPMTVFARGWGIGGYDPVAYVTRDAALQGSANISTAWRGKQYHFVSEENRGLFEANPRAYIPGFDGYCVVSLSNGNKTRGDPRYFVIIGQRVYLVKSEARKAELLAHPREILMKAKEYWIEVDQ